MQMKNWISASRTARPTAICPGWPRSSAPVTGKRCSPTQRKPPLFLCRGKGEDRLLATGAQTAFRPAESRTGRRKALLVLGGGGIRAETAQPGLLCLAYRSGNDSPLFQTAGERGRLQTLLGSMLVQYPAETISGSHARHHDKQMGRIMNSLGAERMHTTTGNMYKLVALAG